MSFQTLRNADLGERGAIGHRGAKSVIAKVTVITVVLLLQACATVANPDRRDPLESLNRSIFNFNDKADRYALEPVAKGYQAVTPDWFRRGVGNVFNNLDDVWSIFNNAIQGRKEETGDSIGRVMVNSTLGFGGLLDIASEMNIERHPSNFALTLGRWGVGAGPYLVLPLLGPATVRDLAAYPVDFQGNLVTQIPDEPIRTGLSILGVVDTRAQYLKAGQVVSGAALDKYSFFRDAYLQRQRNRIYDGNPPDEEDEALPP